MKYTDIIWDFNGTILDDVDVCISCANYILQKNGLNPIYNKEQYLNTFCFPITEYYTRLGFDFNKVSFDTLAHDWLKTYHSLESNCKIYDGVESAMAKFKRANLKQTVISATELNMLTQQLKKLGINQKFNAIYGLDNINAASKKALAQDWIKNNPSARPVFIGDTEHDYEVAMSIRADCILVSSGHQPKSKLEKIANCPVFDNVDEACKYILSA